ncbi:serine protease [Limnoraphis robusta Tam1]|uniref:S1 family peptidase n=1 Tax=Limnoraphis robusta TaxID=1118279 RepID=UPI002B1F1CC4|nr:serine protease [Limnoraphis robusta]MEA5542988.1 serine protease [Limnoraphis robusta Tam1]
MDISPSFSVSEIAQQITVRILTNPGAGSGVIISRQGSRYIVVTNDHVVVDSRDNRYQILTSDGSLHQARWLKLTLDSYQDLALLEFTSNQAYEVARLRNSETLSVGDPIYASGFPNWNRISSDRIDNTRDWGLRAYKFTEGQVSMILSKSLQRGYQIGYTNDLTNGMSGGAILNQFGYLVGINGKGKYPLAGIRVYIFADGTKPPVEVARRMETLSWGIPSTTIQRSLVQLTNIQLSTPIKNLDSTLESF